MPPNPNDYAIGTANYNAVLNSQGQAAADAMYQAAINAYRNQTPLNTSTWSILSGYSPSQIVNNATDYWSAQASNVASDFWSKLFGSLGGWTFIIIVGSVLFFWLGGAEFLRGKLKK